jgi:hypothetical protein
VGGAADGIWLVVEVAAAVAVLVTVTVALGEPELTPGVLEALVPEEGVTLGEVELPLEADAAAEPVAVPVLTDGVKVGTVGVEEDPLQAETATGARRVRAPQPRAVSLARSGAPAIVVRTFMGPPFAPGRSRLFFPVLASETGLGRENACPIGSTPARLRADPRKRPRS